MGKEQKGNIPSGRSSREKPGGGEGHAGELRVAECDYGGSLGKKRGVIDEARVGGLSHKRNKLKILDFFPKAMCSL